MTEKAPTKTLLNDINEQFGELMDLFDKVPDSRALKHFETYLRQTRKQSGKRNRWLLIGCLFCLSLLTCYVLASDELIYNIYFVGLAFVRILLIKVKHDGVSF